MSGAMEMHPAQTPAKEDVDFVESTEAGIPSTYADIVSSHLSKAHRDYLMERHGTLELDPIPSMDPADPYNWPSWKVSGVESPFCRVLRRFVDKDHANGYCQRILENCKSSPSSVSCVHGHFCGCRHHPGLSNVWSSRNLCIAFNH